jgi:integrase
MKPKLRIAAPATEKRTVLPAGSKALATIMPTRQPNATYRTREHLTAAEIGKLLKVASRNRWGHRDATMILVAYRHGLRVSELVDLRWDQIDFDHARLHVRRLKQGTPATHPIPGDEMRDLRKLQREQDPKTPFVFTSEREARLPCPSAYAQTRLRVRLGQQGARYEKPAGLSGAQEYSAHREIHRAVADPLQGFLEKLIIDRPSEKDCRD